MTALKAENYHVEKTSINGVELKITTYKIGEKFYCHIENKDPGATIARAEGINKEEARQLALQKIDEGLS